jgi:hypothetical protein
MTCKTPKETGARYQEIARDSRYQHFVRIGPRIVCCLDHFRIEFDRGRVGELLQMYYLFIGVIDEALDSGGLSLGNRILEQFDRPASELLEHTDSSNVEFMTEALRNCISDENRSSISTGLAELYGEVLGEQAAILIDTYIEHRKVIGARTAELSYTLIQNLLTGETDGVYRLMMQVGKVGCLIDSIIDLGFDSRSGLLSFKPSLLDRVKLIACALREGVVTLLCYPSLTNLFAAAVVDNIRDRFRARHAQLPPEKAERKDKLVRAT